MLRARLTSWREPMPGAAMRPSAFTDGNVYLRASLGRHDNRFNEAVGFHRRKLLGRL